MAIRFRHGASMIQFRFLKIFCAAGFLAVLVSNIVSMSGWTENRAVNDDFCYLRQAHLFQRFGLGGMDTDVARDDDNYVRDKLKEMNYGTSDPTMAPCHTFMPASGKRVLQYPPGTGFALSLFPPGFQVIPLYALATTIIAAFSALALWRASSLAQLILAALFGDVAIYLMINPTKASYSMAPTMIVCALVGFLTVRMLREVTTRERLLSTLAVGLLIGLSVNFRIPNLLLGAGYCIFLLTDLLSARSRAKVLQCLVFGAALLTGMVPTLAANWINAGSPLTTTYSSGDTMPPAFDMETLRSYLGDLQFLLLLAAIVWTAAIWRRPGARQTVLVVAANLVVNILFFATHPVFTPYYTVPIAMLSLWTLLFATLAQPDAVAENPALAPPAKA